MGKPIRVTLGRNQSVVTEFKYAVSIQAQLYKPDHSVDQTIIMEIVRATSIHEAVGMALYKARLNEKFTKWSITNWTALKVGE